jgi:hypothetical protein
VLEIWVNTWQEILLSSNHHVTIYDKDPKTLDYFKEEKIEIASKPEDAINQSNSLF